MSTTGPGQSASLLLDVVDVLDRKDIPYAVVGAMAVAFHGIVRASQDADAVVSLGMRALPGLQKNLRARNLRAELHKGAVDDPIRAVLTVHDQFGNRVDLLMGIRGMEAEALSRGVAATFRGTQIRVIGAEDLIAMKINAGSPRDLQDALGILRVCSRRVDVPLLKRVTRRYGTEEVRKLVAMLKAEGIGR